jgi:hypothetical protein
MPDLVLKEWEMASVLFLGDFVNCSGVWKQKEDFDFPQITISL